MLALNVVILMSVKLAMAQGWQSGMGDNHDHYGAGVNKIPCGNCSNGCSKGDENLPLLQIKVNLKGYFWSI